MDPGPRRRLGRSTVELTRLGFGGAPIGNLFAPVADGDAVRAIEASWRAGLRYFDTAPLYGHGLSEQRFGRALSGQVRSEFAMSTKVGRLLMPVDTADGGAYVDVPAFQPTYDYSYDGAMRSFEASLERLRLDRIDLLLIHDIDAFTHAEEQPRRYREAMAGAYRALDELRRSGAVGAIGLGVNDWRVCEQAAADGDFDGFLVAGRYTLLEQEPLDSFLPLCARRGIGVIAAGVFNSGILATGPVDGAMYNYRPAPAGMLDRARRIQELCRAHGVSLAAAALQFPLLHPAVTSVVLGMRSEAEVIRNLDLMAADIPEGLWRDLKGAGLLHAAAPTKSAEPP
ncbi:MAG: aldo/keto reductase [Alphaproteobacteria bacterium]|nr:aldo/keto reductase [Alphaproteobacteria bacterium]